MTTTASRATLVLLSCNEREALERLIPRIPFDAFDERTGLYLLRELFVGRRLLQPGPMAGPERESR